ncbi:U3 small nucleolar RNA-associated protein 14 homolog A-like isoform X3 [Montipora foliosa]|uniref:U3 small nucleolar RNA-associated protein 14 homolog A-like isoform X3 n=1 Tax=Montipora foliosa TaxID=591990 RepID=UPI0035F123FE
MKRELKYSSNMATAMALKIAPVVNSDDIIVHENSLESASEDEQDSGDEKKHADLLKDISSLGSSGEKRNKHLPQRSEPSNKVSEFHLSAVKDKEEQVELSDLIGSLSKSSEHGKLKKKLVGMQKNSGTLDVPLSKPEAQKIQRIIAYGQAKQDVHKWAPTVKKNREAEHLAFPLKPFTPPVPTLRGLAVNFKPRTPLEEEIAAVLKGSSHVLEREKKELTADEERALLAMDFEEAKERRGELQKLRALQSYYELKCHRIKKIKSRKYRRVKRKAEMRAAAKMPADEDQQNDEDTTEVQEKADQRRALERVSLKHRNTTKWARYLMKKGSKSAEAKKLLQEQLRISRTLTEKDAIESESEEESTEVTAAELEEIEKDLEDVEEAYGNLLTSEDNPWRLDSLGARPHPPEASADGMECDSSTKLHRLQPIRTEEANLNDDEGSADDDEEMESEDEFEVKLVKSAESRKKKSGGEPDSVGAKKGKKRKSEIVLPNARENAKKTSKVNKTDKFGGGSAEKSSDNNDNADACSSDKEGISLKKNKKGKKFRKRNTSDKSKGKTEKLVLESNVSTEKTVDNDVKDVDECGNKADRSHKGNKNFVETERCTPNDIRVDPKKIFRIEDQGNASEENEDTVQQKRIDIQQAFANDDVVEEFVQEKSDIVKASEPKDVDLSLPGWGSWAGAGIKPSEAKKKRFIKKADPAPPRKDKDLSHVIINEEKSKLFSKTQVSEVPYPYDNHVQFERSMRNPVGKHWNTGTAVNQLTKPRVSTLIGTIIEPIKATKEIKRSRHEDNEKKKKETQSSGIAIHG